MGSRSLNETQAKTAAESMPAPKLGTAHGQRETPAVSQSGFERLQMQPSEPPAPSIAPDPRADAKPVMVAPRLPRTTPDATATSAPPTTVSRSSMADADPQPFTAAPRDVSRADALP
jgi:hypothetical protein